MDKKIPAVDHQSLLLQFHFVVLLGLISNINMMISSKLRLYVKAERTFRNVTTAEC